MLLKTTLIASLILGSSATTPPPTTRAGTEDTSIVGYEELTPGGALCSGDQNSEVKGTASQMPSLWSDCDKLKEKQRAKSKGVYTLTNYTKSDISPFTALDRVGTCTFGVKPANASAVTPDKVYKITGDDIASIMDSPLNQKKVNGSAPEGKTLMQYSGVAFCSPGDLVWGIYDIGKKLSLEVKPDP